MKTYTIGFKYDHDLNKYCFAVYRILFGVIWVTVKDKIEDIDEASELFKYLIKK